MLCFCQSRKFRYGTELCCPGVRSHHNPTKLICLRVRQWIQKHAVDDREQRGIHADAQRQRQNRDRRKARRLAQRARAITQILQQILQPRPRPLIVRHVLNHSRVAQLALRRCAAPARRFAARLAIARGHLQMAGDFFIQFVLASLAPAPQEISCLVFLARARRRPQLDAVIHSAKPPSDPRASPAALV